jgi:hypothetical protein
MIEETVAREVPAPFDASVIATASAEAEMQVMHPVTDTGVDLYITLVSFDHPRVKERQRKHFKSVIRHNREKTEEDVLDETEQTELDILTAATVSWRSEAGGADRIMHGGKWLQCTAENVRRVYADVPVIAEQARRWSATRANFMKG